MMLQMLHLFDFHCSVEKKLLFRKLIANDVEIASPEVHKLTQIYAQVDAEKMM